MVRLFQFGLPMLCIVGMPPNCIEMSFADKALQLFSHILMLNPNLDLALPSAFTLLNY